MQWISHGHMLQHQWMRFFPIILFRQPYPCKALPAPFFSCSSLDMFNLHFHMECLGYSGKTGSESCWCFGCSLCLPQLSYWSCQRGMYLSPLTVNLINTLKSRQNGCHFVDDISNCSFLNENVWISIKNSLKFVPRGQINHIPALVQKMVWRTRWQAIIWTTEG